MKGFSLIELMIVLCIITILGMVAVPSYQEYITRAKVTNLLGMAQPAKLAVSEALISGTPANVERITNQDILKELRVTENVIQVTGDSDKLGIRPKEKTLVITLTPSVNAQNMIVWKCTVEGNELKKYAPTECRQ